MRWPWLSRNREDDGSERREWLARKERNRRDRDYRAFVGPPELFDQVGCMQRDLLVRHGLSREHYLLDVGCGSLRAGRLLIPLLSPGHYFGIEPEAWLVEEGVQRELGPELAREKRPVFSHDPGFELSRFGRSFDFVLAHSIFSHATPEQLGICLTEAAKVMRPGSLMAATYVPGPRDYAGSEWAHCAHYRPQGIAELAASRGLTCEPLDWPHPTGQQWVLMRPLDAQAGGAR